MLNSRQYLPLWLAAVGATVGLLTGCDLNFSSAPQQTSPTAPSTLRRIVDDVPGFGPGGSSPVVGECDSDPTTPAPPCPAPGPQLRPVVGEFTVTAANGSTISDTYSIITDSSGLSGLIGNAGEGNNFMSGTGRFSGVVAGFWSVALASGQNATFNLKVSVQQPNQPLEIRTFGDSGVFAYKVITSANTTCISGSRVEISFEGIFENIGRFRTSLRHCVSHVQ